MKHRYKPGTKVSFIRTGLTGPGGFGIIIGPDIAFKNAYVVQITEIEPWHIKLPPQLWVKHENIIK